ncbi:MAG: hypothetical protein ACK5RO_06200 [Pseudobdellovibrionaceae bacterium]|jgi:hypothetical protein
MSDSKPHRVTVRRIFKFLQEFLSLVLLALEILRLLNELIP